MRIYDISVTLSNDMPTWPGDPTIEIKRFSDMEAGDAINVSEMHTSLHIGTHVDAPFHFLGGDSTTIEALPLNLLTGRAYVLHLPDNVDIITAQVLGQASIPPRTRRLLIRTRNSNIWARGEKAFQTDYVALDESGANFLVERGMRVVGVDYLSVGPFKAGREVHTILFKGGVIPIEGVDLSQVAQGRYTLYCLPLKIAGADGAPARAILVGV
jgi:arylformamidase